MSRQRLQLNIRISQETKDLFQQAADKADMTVAGLIKDAAIKAAKKILSQKTTTHENNV